MFAIPPAPRRPRPGRDSGPGPGSGCGRGGRSTTGCTLHRSSGCGSPQLPNSTPPPSGVGLNSRYGCFLDTVRTSVAPRVAAFHCAAVRCTSTGPRGVLFRSFRLRRCGTVDLLVIGCRPITGTPAWHEDGSRQRFFVCNRRRRSTTLRHRPASRWIQHRSSRAGTSRFSSSVQFSSAGTNRPESRR